jgi:hypothetical protein
MTSKKHTVNIGASVTINSLYEDQLANIMAKNIQDEIDWQILNDMGFGHDWIEIKYSDYARDAGSEAIKEWCGDKFTYGFFAFSDRIMISVEEDVVKFMLRWS